MIGTIVNVVAIAAGSTIGLLLQRGVSKRVQTVLFQVLGLITLVMGVGMVHDMEHVVAVIVSLIVGSLLGMYWDLEGCMDRMGHWLERKVRMGNAQFTKGLVTAFVLFCIGSMTVLGAIQDGMGQGADLLYTKSAMDFCSSIILASTFGVGVLFSVIPLFLFQGTMTLLAGAASAFFTPDMLSGITAVGGIMLIGLGLDILEIKKISIANMLPSLALICLVLWLLSFFAM